MNSAKRVKLIKPSKILNKVKFYKEQGCGCCNGKGEKKPKGKD